jgi:hypothetical protein
MLPFIAKTIVLTANMFLPYQPADIYPLLCPVREYEWIDGWKCDMVKSESGVNEKGCIFRTNFDGFGGPEIWVTSVYEPNERLEFVRTSPDLVTLYEIELNPVAGGTNLTWSQYVTALNENGNLLLEKRDPKQYNEMIKSLETKLDVYLIKHKGGAKPATCTPSAN